MYLKIDNQNFSLSYDEKHTKNYLIINCHDIISINKRQINKYDINKISIHYRDPTSLNSVKELKLKVLTRGDLQEWFDILRLIIIPKKFEFEFSKKKEKKLQMFPTIQYNPWKLFYVINSLDEYLRKKTEFIFFQKLKKNLLRKFKSSVSNLSYKNSVVDWKSLQEVALHLNLNEEVKSLNSKFNDDSASDELRINSIHEQRLNMTLDKVRI